MGDQDRHGSQEHPDHEAEIEIEEAGDKGGEMPGFEECALHQWLAGALSRRMRTAIGPRVVMSCSRLTPAIERVPAGR